MAGVPARFEEQTAQPAQAGVFAQGRAAEPTASPGRRRRNASPMPMGRLPPPSLASARNHPARVDQVTVAPHLGEERRQSRRDATICIAIVSAEEPVVCKPEV